MRRHKSFPINHKLRTIPSVNDPEREGLSKTSWKKENMLGTISPLLEMFQPLQIKVITFFLQYHLSFANAFSFELSKVVSF